MPMQRRGGQQQHAAQRAATMPHSTETFAPARSEMRPAHGRLASVAMYWMLMTSPASTAL